MQAIGSHHPLRRLFAGLVEDAFCAQVGLCDPALNDYLVDLLVSFTHIDRLHAVGHAQGKRLDQIASMLMVLLDEQPASTTERDRSMYRHIGDYTLFWSGVYPEHLKHAVRDRSDVLVDYVTQGKKSYAIVSDLVDEHAAPPSSLFRHLSDDFESCVYGLGLVRHGWEQSAHEERTELIF